MVLYVHHYWLEYFMKLNFSPMFYLEKTFYLNLLPLLTYLDMVLPSLLTTSRNNLKMF